jgi:hypothetical protein
VPGIERFARVTKFLRDRFFPVLGAKNPALYETFGVWALLNWPKKYWIIIGSDVVRLDQVVIFFHASKPAKKNRRQPWLNAYQ